MAGLFLHRGWWELTAAVLLGFTCYLRPGELEGLTRMQLVPPSPAGGQPYMKWGILLHPTELGRPGKTGIFDDAVTVDRLPELTPLLQRLWRRGGRATDRLWSFPLGLLQERFQDACEALHLQALSPTLYSLRHGGASEDILRGHRTLAETKKRGRWSSDSSLKRYSKDTRLMSELAKVPVRTIDYGRRIERLLPALLAGTAAVPCPPV